MSGRLLGDVVQCVLLHRIAHVRLDDGLVHASPVVDVQYVRLDDGLVHASPAVDVRYGSGGEYFWTKCDQVVNAERKGKETTEPITCLACLGP